MPVDPELHGLLKGAYQGVALRPEDAIGLEPVRRVAGEVPRLELALHPSHSLAPTPYLLVQSLSTESYRGQCFLSRDGTAPPTS
jgi:hypothetical protein